MKLITFTNKTGEERIGWLEGDMVVDMNLLDDKLPTNMLSFIDNHESYFKIISTHLNITPHYKIEEVKLLPPLPNPRSFRDYVAFEEHMLNASKSFGHPVSKDWYDMPIFYFTNHHGVYGPNDDILCPKHETNLDIELEMAVVIGKKGKDITEEEAGDYIFGYTVFNDWTARAIQRKEMTVPLGPHKGKDFANSIGPCIITKDEMEQYRCSISRQSHPEHLAMPPQTSNRFDLKMTAKINGRTICKGNYKTVHWTFPEMIQRASENNVTLMPGDILGSGTVGWGSLMENNFSVHRPLASGDEVELEIEGIGVLKNKVVL
ncbi:fumarylacetoacetate hydrolase family protein [Formosa sp. S-31]|uniref:fumarylacetoacetate hydrolase family protein n=1 Tax=Formosa sp. S-31 TaxID=2790949 RepID=UPI003EBECACA